MTLKAKLMCSGVALLTLAACGGSGGGAVGVIIGADEEGLRLFADVDGDGLPDGDLVDLLEDGETVTARVVSTSAIREEFGDEDDPDGSNALADATISFELDGSDLIVHYSASGGPVVSRTVASATTLEEDNFQIEDPGFFDIFINRNDFDEFLEGGRGYALAGGIFDAQEDDNFGHSIRFVVGAETQDAAIDALGSEGAVAAYEGGGSIDIRQADAGFNTFNGGVFGDVTLVADFGSGTVFGLMDQLEVRERRDRVEGEWTVEEQDFVPGGIIVLNPTDFSTNGFEGTMTANQTLTDAFEIAGAVASGTTYSGAFFGPQAEEVGGTFSGEASVAGESGTTGFVSMGQFLADSYVCCE